MGHPGVLVHRIVVASDKLVQHVHVSVDVVLRDPLVQFRFQRPLKTLHDGIFHVWILSRSHLLALVVKQPAEQGRSQISFICQFAPPAAFCHQH